MIKSLELIIGKAYNHEDLKEFSLLSFYSSRSLWLYNGDIYVFKHTKEASARYEFEMIMKYKGDNK